MRSFWRNGKTHSNVNYYDNQRHFFSRDDFGQQKPHHNITSRDARGRIAPHTHQQSYNERGFPNKKVIRKWIVRGNPLVLFTLSNILKWNVVIK